MKFSSCSLLCLLLFLTSCNGQIPSRQEEDQLRLIKTQSTDQFAETRCSLEDQYGNLWFGTTGEGVYRYDGKRFIQFTTKDGLISNTVWSVLEDKAGNIWLGTEVGLCRYDGKTFVRVPITVTKQNYFASSSTNNSVKESAVWCMLEDKNGGLWFCTMNGVYYYNGASFSHFPNNSEVINKDSVQLNAVGYILEDKKGNIWFGSGVAGGDGLCCYDGQSITSFKPDGDTWIRYIVEDKNGTIWFGTRSHGNWFYDGKNFNHYTEKERIGAPALVDKNGNIWFTGDEHDNGYSSQSGVWCYDGKSFKNFTTKDGMGDYGVWCIMEDRAGNLWFGTRNTGLYQYDGKKFTNFSD